MAFVSKTEKEVNIQQKENIPGPGSYFPSSNPRPSVGYAPFGSTTKKVSHKKKEETPPGPGAYHVPASFEIVNKSQRVYFSTLSNPATAIINANLSTTFKSKVPRFESKQRHATPGPGSYYKEPGPKTRNSFSVSHTSNLSGIVERVIEYNRKGIPSIPSHQYSYGYSEIDKNNLIANNNPLLELQKYVGPGYYQTKDLFGAENGKGISWQRSNAKRFEETDGKRPTGPRIGPGTYQNDGRPSIMYAHKPNAVFLAKGDRNSFIGNGATKVRSRSVQPNMKAGVSLLNEIAPQDHSEIFLDQLKAEDVEALQEYEDRAPGPGHYNIEKHTTSLKVKYKPPRFQFFGSATERFKDQTKTTTTPAGPGEYTGTSKSVKPKKIPAFVPFGSTDVRFGENPEAELPGPGAYEIKNEILQRIKEKERNGYIGSFGTTDRRFKEQLPTTAVNIGPGTYVAEEKSPEHVINEEPVKNNQVFESKVERNIIQMKKDIIPPPGSYDIDYYDVSKRVKVDPNRQKRPGFNSSVGRFKEAKPNENEKKASEEEKNQQAANEKRYTVSLERRTRGTMNAVFASQTGRNQSEAKELLPGPGHYTRNNATGWVKKTYNINFISD